MLDFGAGRKYDSSHWGAIDFSNHAFSNSEILTALEHASDGIHNGYTGAGTFFTLAYGNSNYHMSNNGMTNDDAYNVGYYQSDRARQLANYQSSQGYSKQGAAAGSDMGPAWDGHTITRNLVDGCTADGYALYYDFGSADGAPTSGSGGNAANGWTVADLAYVSFHGTAVPLPEIYYKVNADQWTVVRRNWNNNHSTDYFFMDTTATEGLSGGLTPKGGWNALESRNSGIVLNELIDFGL